MQIQITNAPVLFNGAFKSNASIAEAQRGETAWTKEVMPARPTLAQSRTPSFFNSEIEQRGTPDSPLHD